MATLTVAPVYAQDEPRTTIETSYVPLSEAVERGRSQSPVIMASINGYGYRFLLDTGAVISLLRQSVVPEAGLMTREIPAIAEDKALSRMLRVEGQLRGATVPALTLGAAAISDVFFHVAPEPVLEVLTKGNTSFAGIIGANFLKNTALCLDTQKKKVTFLFKGKLTGDERARLGFGSDAVAAPLLSAGSVQDQYLVEAYCNDRPVRLFLDTGAEHTYIHKPMSDFDVPPTSIQEFQTSSIYGKSKAYAAPTTLAVGTNRVPNLVVHFEEPHSSEADGLLGMDFLSQYHVLIDFPAKKIYLRPRTTKN